MSNRKFQAPSSSWMFWNERKNRPKYHHHAGKIINPLIFQIHRRQVIINPHKLMIYTKSRSYQFVFRMGRVRFFFMHISMFCYLRFFNIRINISFGIKISFFMATPIPTFIPESIQSFFVHLIFICVTSPGDCARLK